MIRDQGEWFPVVPRGVCGGLGHVQTILYGFGAGGPDVGEKGAFGRVLAYSHGACMFWG